MTASDVNDQAATGLTQFRRSLTRADKTSLWGMYGFIVALHILGFVVLFAFVVPNNYQLGGDHPVFTVGVGVLAYTLGLRHAFDADHIAAVDNTTRKLIADNLDNGVDRKPLSVGFWFSLGHSTIVFALSLLLALGVKALVGPVADEQSTLHTITGMIGPSVSGIFLWVLGILNLVALLGIAKVFQIAGTAGVIAYSFSFIPSAIWFGAYTRTIVASIIDGVVYGVITGAVFAWRWPH